MKKLLIVFLSLVMLLSMLPSCDTVPPVSESSSKAPSEGSSEVISPVEEYSDDLENPIVVIDNVVKREIECVATNNGKVALPLARIAEEMGASVSWYTETVAVIGSSNGAEWILDTNTQTLVRKGTSNNKKHNIIVAPKDEEDIYCESIEQDILLSRSIITPILQKLFNDTYINVSFDSENYIIDIITSNPLSTNVNYGYPVYKLSDDGTYYIVMGLRTPYKKESLLLVEIPKAVGGIPVKEIRSLDFVTDYYYEVPEYDENQETLELVPKTSTPQYVYAGESKIEDLIIPASVEMISSDALDTSVLNNIVVAEDSTSYKCVDGILYSYDGKRLLAMSDSTSPQAIDIPEGTEIIGSHAFKNKTRLLSISLPSSLTTIEDDAFYGCYRLVEVRNSSQLSLEIGDDGNGSITKNALEIYSSADTPSAIAVISDEYMFLINENRMVLMDYLSDNRIATLPTDIGQYEIAPRAFCDNSKIIQITIPSNVTKIGDSAFLNATNLCRVSFYNVNDYLGMELGDLWSSPFASGASLYQNKECIRRLIINSDIDDNAFYNCDTIREAVIENGASKIGENAFALCDELESVRISVSPEGVLGIGAFRNCNKLSSLELEGGIASISEQAFANCTSLKEIKLSNGIKKIGKYAFYGCKELRSVEFNEDLEYIFAGAFSGCTELRAVYLRVETSISNEAFAKETVIHRYHYTP